MFFRSEEIEDPKCAFCKQKFIDVVKLIPSCGESICGDCYEKLKANVDGKGEFTCKSCRKCHKMPEDGFPDSKSINRMLKRTKFEKPLSEEAKTLKRRLESLPNQMRELKSFDDRDYINEYCDQLEVEIIEEIDSLMKLLNDIQKDLLEQTREYRKQCLDSLSTRSTTRSSETNEVHEKLQELSKEINKFNHNWHQFFNQADTISSHKDIKNALSMARAYDERINAFNRKVKRNALNGQVLEFKTSHSFLDDPGPLRKLFCLLIQDNDSRELNIEPIPLRTLNGHSAEINQVIFLSDDKLASCSDDATIKVWNVENGALLHQLKGHTKWVNSLTLLMNGWLASGSCDNTVRLWDLGTRKETCALKGHTDSVASLQVLKDGLLASYALDNTIRIWNPYATEKHLLQTITGHGNKRWLFPLGVLSNDNLVTISRDNDDIDECILRVWNPGNGRFVKAVSTGFSDAKAFAVLSNDQVAIGFENGTIKIIDLTDDSKSLSEIHHKGVDLLVELPNGNLLSTDRASDSDDKSKLISMVKIWKRDGLHLLQTIETDHSHEILSVVTSPNGKLMATAGRDKTIKLWSVKSI